MRHKRLDVMRSISLTKQQDAALVTQAQKEGRSISNMLRTAVVEYLEAQGQIPAAEETPEEE